LALFSAFKPIQAILYAIQALVYTIQVIPHPFPELMLCEPFSRSVRAIPGPAASLSLPAVMSLALPTATLPTAALPSATALPISVPVHVTLLLLSLMLVGQ
jgi:hypothetical protein